jgi:uncharacterized membrane protein YagU involved in acid resistance
MDKLAVRVALLGGLAIGTLDLVFAIVFWCAFHETRPMQILQSIAAGLVGREAAYDGGARTAALGAVCHYTIATGMSLAYYLVAREWRQLVRAPVLLGAAYGVLLYLIMTFVVLPLSAVGMPKFANIPWVVASVVMHVVFGMLIAQLARLAIRP